ncbi:MAG: DUF4258 domain-containing protein [Planctomycetes bacterium]|nr:DUF4258 domain-containing protein [Planctomycetota bacterium]
MDWLNCFKSYRRIFRAHALERMVKRNIGFSDIDEITENLEIIEEYPNDFPYPNGIVTLRGEKNDMPNLQTW